MRFRDAWRRLRAFAFRGRLERELRDEVQFHLEMQARKHRHAGLGADEAERRARAEFGSVELAKEDARDVHRIHFLDDLAQDVRYSLRAVRRAPAFALTVVFTIAAGLGLNTTVFTIFNAYVLRPLEVRDPYSLYEFYWLNREGRQQAFTWDEYGDLRRNSPMFSETLARRHLFSRVDGQPAFGEMVTGNYFRMLGIGAALGRTLQPEDALAPGASAVVVLSHATWLSRYGGDSAIIGRTMTVRGVALQVVGVARAGFGGVDAFPRDFWIPITMIGALDPGFDLSGPGTTPIDVVLGRLAAGVTPKRASASLATWARAVTSAAPDPRRAQAVVLESRATAAAISPPLLVLLAPIVVAFGLVLVIACANVANMMLARGMARQREIGIRLSLGAARSRLIRQLLTESVLLALPAGVLAFAVSSATLSAAVHAMFASIPAEFGPYLRFVPLEPDGRVFTFILLAAVACAVFFGLAPALQATRASVVQTAKGNFDAEHRPSRLRNALVVAQITAASLLLIVSGILYRNSHRLQSIETGVTTHNLLQLGVVESARQAVLANLRSRPAIDAVAAATKSPLDGSFTSVPVSAARSPVTITAFFDFVSADYFKVLEIPLVGGRPFTPQEEVARAPVAIVSQTLARRLWPGQDAVGQSIAFEVDAVRRRDDRFPLMREATVVGIARDAVSGVLVFGVQRPVAYLPTDVNASGTQLILRVRGDADRVRRALDVELDRIHPGSVDNLHKMDELVAGELYPFRAAYWVSSAVGAIALLLTLTGIYGVLSYLVTQRSREIGIRLALGASAGAVVGLVLRQSLRLALIGLAAGSLLALGASRVLAAQLSFFRMFDALAYAAGSVIVVLACIAAAVVPSRRAARIDPVDMLRQD